MSTTNPLKKYFRQPTIYVRLPSEGKFYPPGSLNMPENNELPVYPMTSMDEISYRTADALFNGSAVVDVIRSCVPNIIKPWDMPNMDIDAVLVAIRIASFGHTLDMETKCPTCNEENTHSVDLRFILDSIKSVDYTKQLIIGDMTINFKPLSYQQQNQNSMNQFEDSKLLESLPTMEISEEEKLNLIKKSFVKLGHLSINSLAQSIQSIEVAGDSSVVDPAHIEEFIYNADTTTYGTVRDFLVKLRENSQIEPLKLKCNSCEAEYAMPFTLDPASFFA